MVREGLLEEVAFHQSVMGEEVNHGLRGKRASQEEGSVNAEALCVWRVFPGGAQCHGSRVREGEINQRPHKALEDLDLHGGKEATGELGILKTIVLSAVWRADHQRQSRIGAVRWKAFLSSRRDRKVAGTERERWLHLKYLFVVELAGLVDKLDVARDKEEESRSVLGSWPEQRGEQWCGSPKWAERGHGNRLDKGGGGIWTLVTCEGVDAISVQMDMSTGQADLGVWSLGERSDWRRTF